jgi:hypothetical protein
MKNREVASIIHEGWDMKLKGWNMKLICWNKKLKGWNMTLLAAEAMLKFTPRSVTNTGLRPQNVTLFPIQSAQILSKVNISAHFIGNIGCRFGTETL